LLSPVLIFLILYSKMPGGEDARTPEKPCSCRLALPALG
jgi:hypothetical protein